MISTGAFQTEMDASTKQETLAEKFARVWEKKNSKVARASGVSLMALSLAACGSDDDSTDTGSTDTGSTDTGSTDTSTVTPVTTAMTTGVTLLLVQLETTLLTPGMWLAQLLSLLVIAFQVGPVLTLLI